jgi:hypothetical protein
LHADLPERGLPAALHCCSQVNRRRAAKGLERLPSITAAPPRLDLLSGLSAVASDLRGCWLLLTSSWLNLLLLAAPLGLAAHLAGWGASHTFALVRPGGLAQVQVAVLLARHASCLCLLSAGIVRLEGSYHVHMSGVAANPLKMQPGLGSAAPYVFAPDLVAGSIYRCYQYMPIMPCCTSDAMVPTSEHRRSSWLLRPGIVNKCEHQ